MPDCICHRPFLHTHTHTHTHTHLQIQVKEAKRSERIEQERKILEVIESRFVVRLHWTLYNYSSVFLVLDYISGGSLFELQDSLPTRRFTCEQMEFYAMEVKIPNTEHP